MTFVSVIVFLAFSKYIIELVFIVIINKCHVVSIVLSCFVLI